MKKPPHPIGSPQIVNVSLITSIVPNKMIAMIIRNIGLKVLYRIRPSSIPQYSMVSSFVKLPKLNIQIIMLLFKQYKLWIK